MIFNCLNKPSSFPVRFPVRVVRIGSENCPATAEDIADIQQQLAATANDPNLIINTGHTFDYSTPDYQPCFADEELVQFVTLYESKEISIPTEVKQMIINRQSVPSLI